METHYLKDISNQSRSLKSLADKALARTGDEDFFKLLDSESNSIALIVKHLAGNMLSRWTDFLISDGEKPSRNRDKEFEVQPGETKAAILERWEKGWQRLLETVETLTADDLARTVRIRGEAHSVIEAINRQLAHQAYHIGQLVFLAKHFQQADWQSLSIPRGKSEEFNEAMRRRQRS